MSNNAKFFRNSMLHRALDVLSRTPMNESQLKQTINFSSSMPRFNQHVIIPLSNNFMVKRREAVYYITPAGEDTLQTLGRIKVNLPPSTKFVPTGSYDGQELKVSAVRRGADDHMMLPSRVGNSLFYRNGSMGAV